MQHSRFEGFVRSDAVYKTVGEPGHQHEVGVSVWVPRNVMDEMNLAREIMHGREKFVEAGEGRARPVVVRWHGGALINGARNYEEWFPEWYVFNFCFFAWLVLIFRVLLSSFFSHFDVACVGAFNIKEYQIVSEVGYRGLVRMLPPRLSYDAWITTTAIFNFHKAPPTIPFLFPLNEL
jgi:hypothetical protein